ncbi:MAG: hypothetical protein AB7G13_13695 [Lautropia sp.]
MTFVEPIGYLASALVLATFCMRDMVSLRWVAISSNLAFIAYGALADLDPVLALHVVLLPVNALRLAQHTRSASRTYHEPRGTGASGSATTPGVSRSGRVDGFTERRGESTS